MNKKTIGMGIVIVVILMAAWYVGRTNNANSKEGLRVGVLAPLTGNFAVLGEHVRNGFELAKEDLEKNGGPKIDLIVEDACLPKDTVSAVTKLINQDKITLLGGSFCVAGFVPVLPILEKERIISFNTAPNPDSVLGHPYVVSTNASIRLKGMELGKFAANTLKVKTAAVIYYNTPLGEDYRKYFSESFEAGGGKIVSSQVTLVDATDFRTELTKVKAQNPDLIFVVQLAKPLANLLKEARELGVDAKILGNSSNEDTSIIQTAGAAAEGFLISSDEPLPRTQVVSAFDVQYKEKYGQEPDVFARNAYDALMIQSKVYVSCGISGANSSGVALNDCMLKYFHNVKDYDGVSGTITIQEDGTALKPTMFKAVKEGKFVSY